MCIIRKKFRQDLSSDDTNHSMTLEDDDVRKIVTWVVDEGLSTEQVTKDFDVSQRRIQQLVKKYRETGKIPMLKKPGRKPYADYPKDIEERIIQTSKEFQMGATLIAKYLRKKDDVKIADSKVHEVLLENNMARENDNKKGRKKPWVRLLGTRSENRWKIL